MCWKGPLEVFQFSILLRAVLIRFLRDLTNETWKTSQDGEDGDSTGSNLFARWVRVWGLFLICSDQIRSRKRKDILQADLCFIDLNFPGGVSVRLGQVPALTITGSHQD